MSRRAEQITRREKVGTSDPLRLKIPSSPEHVLLARLVVSHVGQIAGFGAEEIYDLKLAVTEAATNVIRHAAVSSFELEYRAVPGAVEITVTDSGGGFDVESLTGATPDGRGGFGIAVIRNLVDELVLNSAAGGGTRLKMIRRADVSAQTSYN